MLLKIPTNSMNPLKINEKYYKYSHKFDEVRVDIKELGGAPSEGVDVASSSFPSVKNQGLIEPVGI